MSQRLTLEEWTDRINDLAMHETVCPLLTRSEIAGQYKPETCVCTVPKPILEKCQEVHRACADLNIGCCLPLRFLKDDIRAFEVADRERRIQHEKQAYQKALGNPLFA